MYKSFVYIETRILLPAVDSVFVSDKNSSKFSVNPEVLSKFFVLAKALGCTFPAEARIETPTEPIKKPECSRPWTGYSLKAAEGGSITLQFHSQQKTIHIEELRIEEDAGRLTHEKGSTVMDYSHAGCPSIKIKTAPSFELGEEVQIFLEELRRLTQYLDLANDTVSDSLIRCNAFVSLAKYPENPNYYVKLRNLNSFNFARKAINAELTRHENMISAGESVPSQSRYWNETKSCSEFYQDRPVLNQKFTPIEPEQIIHPRALAQEANQPETMELPEARRQRFKKQYGVSRLRSEFLCDYKDRADFFEAVAALGANPLNAAHWIASELTRLLNKNNISVSKSKIKPEHFAFIIKKMDMGEMHSATAKTLLRACFETGTSPEKLIKTLNISELSSEREIIPYVQKVISENQKLCNKLKNGEMAPLEFLTGLVMKETHGKAVPQIVKHLIKRELKISVIYMITTGGAISAVRQADYSIVSGDSTVLKDLIAKINPEMPVQIMSAGQYLSEELEPSNWADLISEIATKINAGTASGIVITHGTYTLSYTAALLFWLFSDAGIPIVLTGSSSLPYESEEAENNLKLALETASNEKNGVYVIYGQKILSPLNLHFDQPGSFCNWNLKNQCFSESGPIAAQFAGSGELDKEVLSRMLIEASGKMFMCRLYPGFRSDLFKTILTNSDIHSIFLELYGIGSGNMKNTDFSLKPLLLEGNRRGIRFYCTSQQKSNIDFSQYETAHSVWREGAVPMGYLTTESVVALYFACAIAADNENEFNELMETYASLYSN